MRVLAPSIAVSLLLAIAPACSPVVSVEATVSVADALAAARADHQRGAVVVLDDATGLERVVGVVCGPTGNDQLFSYQGAAPGCAFEADVTAALVPVDDSWTCGGAYGEWGGSIPEGSPIATVTVFEGERDVCRDSLEHVELRLE